VARLRSVDFVGEIGYRETSAKARQGANVTKADIIESVYEKVGFSKKEAAEIVEMVFDTIKETLERGEKIKISGFGNFLVRDKKSRVGRNPQTGEEIEISARRVLTFRPSQVLKNALNGAEMPGTPPSVPPSV
jgi:integration host factor subunit alpha